MEAILSVNPEPSRAEQEVMRTNFCNIFPDKRLEALAIFDMLIGAYREDGRYYHNLGHIKYMLDFIDSHRDKVEDYCGLLLATYFHDAVYNTSKRDNEEESARLAERSLQIVGMSDITINNVSGLVRSTANHTPSAGLADSGLFLDADLYVLGSPDDEYDNYSRWIRQEFAWVPDDIYTKARIAVLSEFLEKSNIYMTGFVRIEREEAARANIGREILVLSQS